MFISAPEFLAFDRSDMLIEPLIVSPDLTLMAAIAVLQQQQEAHALLVFAAEKLVGIVTQRDILNSIAAQQNPLETTVAQVMVQPVVTLSATQLAQGSEIVQIFEQHGFSQLPIVDEQGKILGLLTRDRLWQFFKQTAALSQAEYTTIALRESENQYAALAEAAPVGIFRANLAGEVIWVNRHWTKITDLSFDESLGFKWIRCVHPDWRDRLIESWSKFVQEGTSHAVENCFQMKDGRLKWAFCQAQPEKDIHGNTIGYVGTLTEITRQKQLELNLRESEAELAGLFTAMQDVVLVFERQGIYRKIITHSSNLYNPSVDRLGKTVSAVVPAAVAAIIMDCIDRTFATQTSQTCEYCLEINDQEVWFAATCSCLTAETVLWVARNISDRKQADQIQQQLKAIETEGIRHELNLLEDILESVFAGYWDWDLVNNTEYYSPSWKKMFGYEDHELPNTTETWQKIIHPEDIPDTVAHVNRHIASHGEEPFHRILRYFHKDGSVVWVLCSGRVIEWDEAGNPLRMVGSHLDLTAHKRTEEKLRHSQATLLEAQRLAHIGSWEVDVATGNLNWSPELLRMFGLDPDQGAPTYEQHWNLIHPEDRDRLQQTVERAIATGEAYVIEYRIALPDGTIRYQEGRGASNKDASGNIIRLFGTALDVTEQTLTAQALRESEARWQFALEGSGDGIWDWNAATNQVFFSNQWKSMLGYTPEEIGDSLDEWDSRVHPDDKEGVYEKLNQHFRGEIPVYQSEHRVLCKDGSYKWILDRGKVIQWTADGQPLRVIGTHSDISDRKHTEQELLKAKEEAEAAAFAKSMFLANMSHEIRTPMNGVIGMLNLLQETKLTSKQRSHANIAQSSAESLLNLINDILDFSKVEAGKLDLETVEFDLLEMLSNFAKTIALTAQEKGLELIFDLRDIQQPLVQGDPNRLRQILVNLASNAIKFTEQGDILIRCQLQPTETGLLFTGSVRDSGIGIPVHHLNDLFNPFTQLDASTTRQYGGTGLGLAISTKLCRLMGGDIEAESVLGEGSCFTFQVILQPSQMPSIFPPPESLEPLQVLVVEDNPLQQQVLCDQLRDWGVQVIAVNTAQEALMLCDELENKSLCDRLFVDWSLPDMDGVELGKRLAQKHPNLGRSLIIMTAMHSYNKDVDVQGEQGINAYLTKPIMPQELWQMLLNLKDRSEKELLYGAPQIKPSDIPSIKEPSIVADVFPSNLHLLLVEDNRVNQLVVQGLLKKFGLKTDTAFNGIEALRLMNAAATPYDLVLMDCLMPEMDGYAASQRIRQGEAGDRHRTIPIIALTANAMKGDREKCIQAGMDDYLSKPVNPQNLKTLLSKWLTQKHPA